GDVVREADGFFGGTNGRGALGHETFSGCGKDCGSRNAILHPSLPEISERFVCHSESYGGSTVCRMHFANLHRDSSGARNPAPTRTRDGRGCSRENMPPS